MNNVVLDLAVTVDQKDKHIEEQIFAPKLEFATDFVSAESITDPVNVAIFAATQQVRQAVEKGNHNRIQMQNVERVCLGPYFDTTSEEGFQKWMRYIVTHY